MLLTRPNADYWPLLDTEILKDKSQVLVKQLSSSLLNINTFLMVPTIKQGKVFTAIYILAAVYTTIARITWY